MARINIIKIERHNLESPEDDRKTSQKPSQCCLSFPALEIVSYKIRFSTNIYKAARTAKAVRTYRFSATLLLSRVCSRASTAKAGKATALAVPLLTLMKPRTAKAVAKTAIAVPESLLPALFSSAAPDLFFG